MDNYRPEKLVDFVGQQHLVGADGPINRILKTKELQSLIFYGPPGIGKTSLAQIITCELNVTTVNLNAAKSTIDEMKKATDLQKQFANVVLIIDEIHRLDRKKQDYLLPFLEHDKLIIIGTTTENPLFECSSAIRSRCLLFKMNPLTTAEISKKLFAIQHSEFPKKKYQLEINDYIAKLSQGDIRLAINYLNLILKNYQNNEITFDLIANLFQQNIVHDKTGDYHYNLLSALQKSIRGSDTDAALHYAARLLVVGEEKALCRRLIVIAYEDVGLANPPLCSRTMHAVEAFERLGMPEGRIPIADIVCELSMSPKSNSAYKAIDEAITSYKKKNENEINPFITHYQDENHQYSVEQAKYQNLLPEKYKNDQYYKADLNSKFEKTLSQTYYNRKKGAKNDIRK